MNKDELRMQFIGVDIGDYKKAMGNA